MLAVFQSQLAGISAINTLPSDNVINEMSVSFRSIYVEVLTSSGNIFTGGAFQKEGLSCWDYCPYGNRSGEQSSLSMLPQSRHGRAQ